MINATYAQLLHCCEARQAWNAWLNHETEGDGDALLNDMHTSIEAVCTESGDFSMLHSMIEVLIDKKRMHPASAAFFCSAFSVEPEEGTDGK